MRNRVALKSAIAMALALIAGLVVPTTSSAVVTCSSSVFAGGTGAANDPFLIHDVDALTCMHNYAFFSTLGSNNNFLLVNDIDLTGVDWTRSGAYSQPFNGTFDGGGFEISNFDTFTTNDWAGFFGSVTGTIKNFRLSGDISVNNRGSLIAVQISNGGVARNIVASGSVTQTGVRGGGAFQQVIGSATQILADVDVTCTTRYADCSGFTAVLGGGQLSQVASTGTVTLTSAPDGNNYGISGLVGETSGSPTISNSYTASPLVYQAGSGAGAIVGTHTSSNATITLSNVYATSSLSNSNDSKTGAIFGARNQFVSGATFSATDVYWLQGMNTASIPGSLPSGATNSNYLALSSEIWGTAGITKTLNTVEEKSDADFKTSSNFSTWDTTKWNIQNGSYPTLIVPAATSTTISPSTPTSIASGGTQQFIFTSGTHDSAITNIDFIGANASDFSHQNNCSSTVAANASCTITVTYNGTAAGSANLYVATDTMGQSVALTGQAAPTPTPSPTPSQSSSPTPTPTPSPSSSALGPITQSAGLTPGTSRVTVAGQPISVTVQPNSTSNPTSLTVTGSGFTMEIAGLDAAGRPLGLNADGALVLQEDRTASVSGTGFLPNSDVEIYVFSTPQFLGTVRTNSNGSYSGSVSLPASLATGNHTLQSNGFATNGSVRSVSLGVVVQDRATRCSQITKKIYFEPMSSKLTSASKKALRKIARDYKYCSSIKLNGYVQKSADSSNDAKLSRARAKAVAKYLKAKGVTGRVTFSGNGAPESQAAKAKARRVTIKIGFLAP